MPSAFELLGLDHVAMAELCGFLIGLVSGSICLGLILYDAFQGLIFLLTEFAELLLKFFKKYIFPNVRKKKP